ncbi:MAG TPA: hypothetical protein VHG53_00215 [Candidatus Limnocylindria bacterium]|nr:hypothetical protein [Candidatus Limnocylindria bacterium]
MDEPPRNDGVDLTEMPEVQAAIRQALKDAGVSGDGPIQLPPPAQVTTTRDSNSPKEDPYAYSYRLSVKLYRDSDGKLWTTPGPGHMTSDTRLTLAKFKGEIPAPRSDKSNTDSTVHTREYWFAVIDIIDASKGMYVAMGTSGAHGQDELPSDQGKTIDSEIRRLRRYAQFQPDTVKQAIMQAIERLQRQGRLYDPTRTKEPPPPAAHKKQEKPTVPRVLSLADAAKEGVVAFRLTGTSAGVTSHCELQLTFRTDELLAISIPRGCTFHPTSPGLQTMVCTKATTVQGEGRSGFVTSVTIPTICASPHGLLPPPTDGSATYQVPTTGSSTTAVLDTVDGLSTQLSTIARSIGMPDAMFSEAVAQYSIWWVYGNPGFWSPNLTRDEKTCPYCHRPYGPADFTCRNCGYLPIDFSHATSAETPTTPPVSQQRAGGASTGGHWQILMPPPGSGVPNGGWIWVDGSGQQWTWPPERGGTRVSSPGRGLSSSVLGEPTKPPTPKKGTSGHWVIHDPPPFSRVPNGGVEWVEDDGREQSESRPAAVPVQPFSPKSVGDILSPQLGQRGVTNEQVEKFSSAIWDGIDLTVKTMTQASSRPLLDVVNGGLAAPGGGPTETIPPPPPERTADSATSTGSASATSAGGSTAVTSPTVPTGPTDAVAVPGHPGYTWKHRARFDDWILSDPNGTKYQYGVVRGGNAQWMGPIVEDEYRHRQGPFLDGYGYNEPPDPIQPPPGLFQPEPPPEGGPSEEREPIE